MLPRAARFAPRAARFARAARREASSRAAPALPFGLGLGLAASGSAAAVCLGLPEAEGDGRASPLHRNFIADAAAAALPAVVNISAEVSSRFGARGVSTGSGFVVSEDGLIVTNAHVVAGARGGQVRVTSSDGRTFHARVVAADAASDIAVVRAATRALRPIKIGSSSALRPGDFVVALGSPLNLSNSVTAGIVSNVARHGSELGRGQSRAEYIQTDAAINQGNSGGPLVDLDGKVIGINTMKAGGADGISFAIPIDIAWAVVRALLQHGSVARPYIGIKMQGRRDDSGVLVVQVAPDSPAERAGLRAGDVILAFNGERVRTIPDVLAKIALKPGGVTVTLRRDSELLDATIAVDVTAGPR